MTWDFNTINSLTKLVYQKYNSRFWNKIDEWEAYLVGIGVDRRSSEFRIRSSGDDQIWIECPYSFVNSIFGHRRIYSRQNLYFPKSLAEKILVMEQMPP